MKTLIINTHPKHGNTDHFSQKLLDMFIANYKEKFSLKDLEVLNLYEEYIPGIDKDMLEMWHAQMTGADMTSHQKKIEKRQNEILEQFKRSHRIVIVAPTYNLNITTKMKDYIDNVLIARQTFRYTENGAVGMMTDDYRVMLLTASGSIFTNNDRYTELEFQYHYLKAIFCDMMGFDSFHIVRAQGTALKTAEEVMTEAVKNMQTEFARFYQ